MDLEGAVRRSFKKDISDLEILKELTHLILTTKSTSAEEAKQLAKAVIEEVRSAEKEIKSEFLRDMLAYPRSSVTMGEIGVGCRGEGDFFVHRKIATIASSSSKSFLSPDSQDDAGAVRMGKKGDAIVIAVDGTHSRLSEYPFIAGFHVTRASLRDILVKGAKPLALFTDLHQADDGDIGRLFDFVAGISAICELTDIPLIAGSTLRIGGDMVIGDRMVSCVGAAGIAVAKNIAARRKVKPGDTILMTEGAGGGTICTTAIYSGSHEAVMETLNINFIKASQAVFPYLSKIHAMTDVTNGGLRGDAEQICEEACVGMIFEESRIRKLVNPRVYRLLKQNMIDYLGVSLDSLLIFTPPEHESEMLRAVRKAGVQIDIIGKVVDEPKHGILIRGKKRELLKPLFRESAYTKIKKVVGEKSPEDLEEKKSRVEASYKAALRKKEAVIRYIEKRKKDQDKNA